MTAALAGLVTPVFTTGLTVGGAGAAFVLIPVFLGLGIDVHTAIATALPLNAVRPIAASVPFVRHRLIVEGHARIVADKKVRIPCQERLDRAAPAGAEAAPRTRRRIGAVRPCG